MSCPIRMSHYVQDCCNGWPRKIYGSGCVCIIGLFIDLHTEYSSDEAFETHSDGVSGRADQYVLFPLRVHFLAGNQYQNGIGSSWPGSVCT